MSDTPVPVKASPIEGWNWLHNARKWHYFLADGRSMCGKWLAFSNKDATPDTGPTPDDCRACRVKLDKRKPG